MSTAIDYQSPSPSNIRPRHHYSSHRQSTNDHVDCLNGIELTDFNSPPPPDYTERTDESNPTTETSSSTPPAQTYLTAPTILLQIETTGKPILSLPLPPHPDPIPIYLVDPSSSSSPGDTSYLTAAPKYISLRPSRSSGSCYLISGDGGSSPAASSSSTAATKPPPLSTTTYRFGPGRAPRVRIFNPHSQPPSESHSNSNPNGRDEEQDQDAAAYSSFDILSSGLLTRAVRFKPPHLLDGHASSSSPSTSGSDQGEITEQFFEWRYASRKERKAYSYSSSAASKSSTAGTPMRKDDRSSVDSLLILSKTTIFTKPLAHAHAHGNRLTSSIRDNTSATSETKTTVLLARLVRSSAFRTKGSTPSSAGNGGRLEILDLEQAGYPEKDKSRREMVLVVIVTTCLVMLKREVDRRRAQQIAVLSAAVGGG